MAAAGLGVLGRVASEGQAGGVATCSLGEVNTLRLLTSQPPAGPQCNLRVPLREHLGARAWSRPEERPLGPPTSRPYSPSLRFCAAAFAHLPPGACNKVPVVRGTHNRAEPQVRSTVLSPGSLSRRPRAESAPLRMVSVSGRE